jgi:hypothetical protein
VPEGLRVQRMVARAPADGARRDRVRREPLGALPPRLRAGPRRFTWDVVVDPGADPSPEATGMQLAKLSTGAHFVFERRRPLRP